MFSVVVPFLVTIGMVVVVPLGLRLVPGTGALRTPWMIGAVGGATALWLPRGPISIMLSLVYGVSSVTLATWGVRRVLAQPLPRATRIAVATALVAPAIAAAALIAERAGYPLLGFRRTLLSLTVAHFHYAGFAASLIAGLACQRTDGRL